MSLSGTVRTSVVDSTTVFACLQRVLVAASERVPSKRVLSEGVPSEGVPGMRACGRASAC